MRRGVLAWLLVLPLVSAACGNGGDGTLPSDAAGGDGAAQADGGPDAAAPLSWVDFSVSGCTTTVDDPPRCVARAPAVLHFVIIAPAPIETWLWSFGDGSDIVIVPDPRHEYRVPGLYNVILTVGGPGGTAQATRPMGVEILPAAPGDTCQLDAQCAPAGECVCGEGEGCAAPLAAGLCARVCDGAAGACAADHVCADLSLGGFDAPWRRALCLLPCSDAGECLAGRTCRTLPGEAGGWVRGCFVAGLVEDVGGSCEDATGAPDASRCASGRCAPFGARGLCTATCTTTADCPAGSACADFEGTIGRLCLRRCDTFACDQDPWLACTAPDPEGRLGFEVDEPASAAGYCGPRRCTTDAECGPSGACKQVGTSPARFCQAP